MPDIDNHQDRGYAETGFPTQDRFTVTETADALEVTGTCPACGARTSAWGLSGGLVPSPALVVLLGAIALGRTIFGGCLVLAYGLGRAATLAAGLALVRPAEQAERNDARRKTTRLARLTAMGAASLVIVVGLGLAPTQPQRLGMILLTAQRDTTRDSRGCLTATTPFRAGAELIVRGAAGLAGGVDLLFGRIKCRHPEQGKKGPGGRRDRGPGR